jgi:hypothetical protein
MVAMTDVTAIIPPVRAGTIESCIDFEYDHEDDGYGGFTATGEHTWQFDSRAYHELTGLDLGGDYPWVKQENGHSLRIVTEYRWSHSTYNGDSYTLTIEEVAYRGSTSRDEVYWTRGGYYRLDENLRVKRVGEERQQYHYRERTDEEIPHREITDLEGHVAYSGEQFTRKLHSGILGTTLSHRLDDLIQADSPDEAIRPDTYQQNHNNHEATPADD